MLEIFFTREEAGWNILLASAHNSRYYNFHVFLSAYYVRTMTKIMKRHWGITKTMGSAQPQSTLRSTQDSNLEPPDP